MENLLGVILCGGKSKRMGSDKGLLLKDNKSWVLLLAEKMKATNLPVVLSINNKQYETYKSKISDIPLIIDGLSIDGPLGGLLSVHRSFPDKDLLLMACDLVDMQAATIEKLLSTYSENHTFDYYVYQQHGFTQPFCAIYTARALTGVYRQFEDNLLKKRSLHHCFESGNTLYIPVDSEVSFTNYNSL